MEKSIPQSLPHIKAQQIHFLAVKSGSTEDYVRKIVHGANGTGADSARRPAKSIRAKAILAAAKALNTSIEKGQCAASRKLEVLDID